MTAKMTIARRLMALVMTAGVELALALPLTLSLSGPAAAQFFPFFDRRPSQPLFAPFQEAPKPPPVDYSKAPPPRKPETPPTMTIMVMGDSMADWLAYGLEDAVTDMPGVGVVRKHRTNSGLVRYDPRSDLDWPRVARDLLNAEKPGAVVMMIGLNDRQTIRERPAAKGAAQPPPSEEPQNPNADNDSPDLQIAAPEPARAGSGNYEFRSEKWAEIYSKRIDDTIAALKSKGVPVIWVGLPPVRGPKATADNIYLNDLYRSRAERAGIIYVDVWDGFVDESGKYNAQGPDVEGQIRRLRAGDGVHFTKAGARKLAHYVEREIRRVMSTRPLPVAFPSDESIQQQQSPTLRPGIPATRPLVGSVVPLTTTAVSTTEELAGGSATRPAVTDPVATRVLVKGEPVAPPKGRADDFVWPARGAAPEQSQAAIPAAAPPVDTPPVQEVDTGKKSPPPAQTKQTTKKGKAAAENERNPPSARGKQTKPAASRDVPRPPASVGAR